MKKLIFSINDGAFSIFDAPSFKPAKPFIVKFLGVLRRRLPGLIDHIERVRALGMLKNLTPVLKEELPGRSRLLELVTAWRKREFTKLLIFSVTELLILPFTILLAIVPGPNIVGYLVVVLLWFHLPALKGIWKLKLDYLTDELIKNADTILNKKLNT